jgi:hypothetical protein
LQTWFPFQIQIYLNGREWLARQLERRRVGFERCQNTFLSIEDLPLAQRPALGAEVVRGVHPASLEPSV